MKFYLFLNFDISMYFKFDFVVIQSANFSLFVIIILIYKVITTKYRKKQNNFLVFLKCRLSFKGFNKLDIKSNMHEKKNYFCDFVIC
jgi:hypothetical protein